MWLERGTTAPRGTQPGGEEGPAQPRDAAAEGGAAPVAARGCCVHYRSHSRRCRARFVECTRLSWLVGASDQRGHRALIGELHGLLLAHRRYASGYLVKRRTRPLDKRCSCSRNKSVAGCGQRQSRHRARAGCHLWTQRGGRVRGRILACVDAAGPRHISRVPGCRATAMSEGLGVSAPSQPPSDVDSRSAWQRGGARRLPGTQHGRRQP
mmetsp:Transcript_9085/g.23096  ORF Transcript_9085/g.23096 Transcript_9085/m.23096 type:complete len:210 (+) Transcript_9085:158-787(+)